MSLFQVARKIVEHVSKYQERATAAKKLGNFRVRLTNYVEKYLLDKYGENGYEFHNEYLTRVYFKEGYGFLEYEWVDQRAEYKLRCRVRVEDGSPGHIEWQASTYGERMHTFQSVLDAINYAETGYHDV